MQVSLNQSTLRFSQAKLNANNSVTVMMPVYVNVSKTSHPVTGLYQRRPQLGIYTIRIRHRMVF